MSEVAVFIRTESGILAPCPSHRTPDGAVWSCQLCRAVLMRASFGVLSGLYRCRCGSDVELLIDGRSVDIEAMGQEGVPMRYEPALAPSKDFKDEDFLRELGISPDLATTED